MRFDDRLSTVLRQPPAGKALLRTQYRQLLDLLGTLTAEPGDSRLDLAFKRLGELSAEIPASQRMEILNDCGVRLRNPALVALIAGDEPGVALTAIENAHLTDDEWIDLLPALPVHARRFVRQRRKFSPRVEAMFDQLGLGSPALTSKQADSATDAHTSQALSKSPEKIGAIVRKIEDFRKSKSEQEKNSAPAEKSKTNAQAFDFATDSNGRIIWTDPGMAPMAVGMELASQSWTEEQLFSRALLHHQPINHATVKCSGASAISGSWQIDAKPSFHPLSGHFDGYIGRFRRNQNLKADNCDTDPAAQEADRIRQILHELRTPVGAIQGFSEVIQQQMFGPAPHEYRALAASIAADAARILAGFEELDQLSSLESKRTAIESGQCDFAEVLTTIVTLLKQYTQTRSGDFSVENNETGPLLIAISQSATEKLLWRLLGTVAGTIKAGTQLNIPVRRQNNAIILSIKLPDDQLSPARSRPSSGSTTGVTSALSTGQFGTDFTLRLAAAEAKAAGGWLSWKENLLELRLPGLTNCIPNHSEKLTGLR